MTKRNPVVRDLIQRPPRGAGKHRDRRRELRENDSGKEIKNCQSKRGPSGPFLIYLRFYRRVWQMSQVHKTSWLPKRKH
jgi:hypothetical protein